MNRSRSLIERLEPRALLSAAMVKDLNATQFTNPGLWGIVTAGSVAYLSQEDAEHGWELWKTDGTTVGTTFVKDIRPGHDGAQPGNMVHAGGGVIYFAADDGEHGVELWRSDGTEAGTYLVKDINPGAADSSPAHLAVVNGTLYFRADDATSGAELWKSDGTEAGTIMVEDIAGGTGSSFPSAMVNNDGVLFFRATTSASGYELWKSDGTEAGTVMVKQIASGSSSGMVDSLNLNMVASGGFVYFVGTSTGFGSGREIWRSDGTDAGTTVVRDLYGGSSTVTYANLKKSGNLVYFTLSGSGTNDGLWRTDGTSPGTLRVHTQAPLVSTDVDGTLFFASGASTTERTLYKTDGVSTIALKSGLAIDSTGFGDGNGTLYFAADDFTGTGEELWKSDGTPGGTAVVLDLAPGNPTPTISPFNIVGFGGPGGALFAGFTPETGGALHKTDGTPAGTQLVKDIKQGTAIGVGFRFMPYNGKLYFVGYDGVTAGQSGGELYRTDGTADATELVIDLAPGIQGANIRDMVVFGDHLYFSATNGSTGVELWKTDGTAAGTTPVKDIDATLVDGSEPGGFVVSGNYLFFSATTAEHGRELWRTDGTEAGTLRLTDVTAAANNSGVRSLTDVDGWLYFAAHDGVGFAGLFSTDGASVVPISSPFTAVDVMQNVGGTLFISATTAEHGQELFKLAPGDATPTLVKNIAAGSTNSAPTLLTNLDGTLYFVASGTGGRELWKTDGSEGGTAMVEDINPTGSSSNPTNLVAANGVLYFAADNGTNGREVWRSDGTAAGTYMVKDVSPPGAANGAASRLYAANGFVYFSADDGVHGQEAWLSDGTAQGTVMLGDYFPEGAFFTVPANPAFFTAFNGDVYYRFNDVAHADELWKAEHPDFATLAVGGALTISATGGNDLVNIAVDGSGGIAVTLNGLVETFAAGQVSSIQFAGRAGYDTIDFSGGEVVFSGDLGGAGTNVQLNVAPGARAIFDATQHLASLNLQGGSGAGGRAALTPGGAKLLVLGSLSVDGNAQLDLADNDLILDYTDFSPLGGRSSGRYTGMTGLIASGHNGGAWDGAGVITSMPEATGGLTTLGLGEAADVLGLGPTDTMLWNGQTVDGTTVIVKYTYAGDVNLDGVITGDDYSVIDFNVAVPNAFGYFSGDFNYDGIISGDDYSVIDFNIFAQGTPL